jgi:hypothetical protein
VFDFTVELNDDKWLLVVHRATPLRKARTNRRFPPTTGYQTLHDISPVTLGLQTRITRIYSLHLRLHRAVLVLTGLRLRTSASTGTRGVLILGTALASFGVRCAFCTLLDAAPVVLHALPRLLDREAAVRLLSFSSSLLSSASSPSVGVFELLQ